MCRRLIVAAFFSLLIHFVIGCAGSTKTLVDKESVPQLLEAKILQVTLTNGEMVKFDRQGGQYHEQYKTKTHVIVGNTEAGERVVIAFNNVSRAYVERAEAENGGVFFPVVLIVGIVVAVILAGS